MSHLCLDCSRTIQYDREKNNEARRNDSTIAIRLLFEARCIQKCVVEKVTKFCQRKINHHNKRQQQQNHEQPRSRQQWPQHQYQTKTKHQPQTFGFENMSVRQTSSKKWLILSFDNFFLHLSTSCKFGISVCHVWIGIRIHVRLNVLTTKCVFVCNT